MIGIAAYALLIARSDELTRIRFDGIWTLLYGANWRAITSHTSYWGLFSAPSPLQHTWSLAIEEQFYVIWPLVVFAIARLNREIAARRVVVVALVGAVVGSAWMIASYSPTDSSRSYFGTDTRVASILFGAALAALLAWKPQVLSSSPFALKSLTFLSFAAVATLALMWTRLNGQDNLLYRGGFLAAAVCATIIIAAVVSNRRGVLNTVFALPP